MALSGKDTGGSQFFVCHDALPHLDGVHTVFGKTDQAGMTTVLAIKQGDIINSVRVTDVAGT